MGWLILILAGILSLAGILALAIGKIAWDSHYSSAREISIRWVGVVLLVAAGTTVALDSFTIIPTRNIAVQTSFGKPVGTLDNGFHWIRPWSSTNDFDATIQTLKLSSDKDDNGEPIKARLANSTLADVDVTVQWQVDPKGDITQLYLDYRDFDNIGTNVVRRQLSAALNEVFETYDPLAAMNATAAPDANPSAVPGTTLADLAASAQLKLAAALPKGLLVRSLLIPKVQFSSDIESKISQYNSAIAETRIAEQRQKTAEAQKIANDLLAKAANTPGVLYQNCLDLMERLAKSGVTPWPSFSCGAPPATVVAVK